MSFYKLTPSEEKFTHLIWANEPLGSGDLVNLCLQHFQWKKSTTYTVLKKLCDHKILINENATVRALIKKDAYYANQSVVFVDETFNGSLPKFIAAFFSGKKLNKTQAETLKKLIDDHKED